MLAPNQVDEVPRSGVGAENEFDLLEGTRLETWDIIVIVAYFVIVLGFGLWVSLINFWVQIFGFIITESLH